MFGYTRTAKILKVISKRIATNTALVNKLKVKYENETDETLKKDYWVQVLEAMCRLLEDYDLEKTIRNMT